MKTTYFYSHKLDSVTANISELWKVLYKRIDVCLDSK